VIDLPTDDELIRLAGYRPRIARAGQIRPRVRRLARCLVASVSVVVVLSCGNAVAPSTRAGVPASPSAASAVTVERLKAAAEQALTAVLSYDYRTIGADQRRALSALTGRLAQEFRADAARVATAARQAHAVVKATTRSIGVVDIQSSSGTCVVALDQRSTNTSLAKPRVDRSRVTVHLRLVGSQLRMDDLQTEAKLHMSTHVPDLAKIEAVAADAARRASSYDYRHLNTWKTSILAVATGSFEAQFRQSAPSLEPLFTQNHAKATASVQAVGVVDRNPQQPVVLVFIDEKVTNTATPHGALKRYRMILTLTRQGTRLLLSDLTTV
jgi:hypothetical protein